MSGGLMQLLAHGAQDVFLTGNPQITFFKTIYRRYTNFAMEAIEQTFVGIPDFGQKVVATLVKNADLVSLMYVRIVLPALNANETVSVNFQQEDRYPTVDAFAWCPEIGHAIIESVAVEIGGQEIDKHYSEWLHIWKELTLPPEHLNGYNEMIGNVPEMVNFTETKDEFVLYVPLKFWFCRHTGNSIPIVSLQYHDIRIIVKFRPLEQCLLKLSAGVVSRFDDSNIQIRNASLYVDYIYLDTDERRRFAQASHEYLIEQVQTEEQEEFINGQIRPEFFLNHPTKEIVWTFQHCFAHKLNQWFNSTNRIGEYNSGVYRQDGENPLINSKLILNGFDRFSVRDGNYFNWLQPWQHHSNIPEDGINVYSFSINPEKHQPSGTLNFSRIDSSIMEMELGNFTLVYKFKLIIYENSLILQYPKEIITSDLSVLKLQVGTSNLSDLFGCVGNFSGQFTFDPTGKFDGTFLEISKDLLPTDSCQFTILTNLDETSENCIRNYYSISENGDFQLATDTVLVSENENNLLINIALAEFYSETFGDVVSYTSTSNSKNCEKEWLWNGKMRLFATNYNILRIMGGMGGIAANN
jgi:hypothetical protein